LQAELLISFKATMRCFSNL